MDNIEKYIDSLISEGNGYVSENDRNLLFKLALKEKTFRKKEEFDQFVDERLRLYSEKENCPNCSAEKSKLLQVCDSCGYVMSGAHTSGVSVQALIENIENSIESIKSAPQPNLMNLFKEQYHIILPYLTVWIAVIYGIMSINYNVKEMPVFIGFFAFLSVISFIYRKTKDKYDLMPMVESFKSNFEKTKLLAKRHFGSEASIQNLLKSYEARIIQIIGYKKKIRLQLVLIYGVVLFLTGYITIALPWVSFEDRKEAIDKVTSELYRKQAEKQMAESSKLLHPFTQKNYVLFALSDKPKGFLNDKVIVKSKEITVKYKQENFYQYENDRAGFQLVIDSVLIEVKKKLPKDQKFDLELCAYDENNNPAFFNTILTCTDTSAFMQALAKGKGTCYVGFRSNILPFNDTENREKAKLDIEIYDKAKRYSLVSRIR